MGLPVVLREAGSCLLVGGGAVALRRARTLLAGGARLTVEAPEIAPEFSALTGEVELLRREYLSRTLAGYSLVFACTDKPEVNRRVEADARTAGVLVNCADAPDRSGFLLPATLRRGEFCVSFCCGGVPTLSAQLCREAGEAYPQALGEYAALLRELRTRLVADGQTRERREEILRALSRAQMRREIIAAGTAERMRERIGRILCAQYGLRIFCD